MSRPVVGLACYLEAASWQAWQDVPAALLPHAYVAHVERAGGQAVLLPPATGRTEGDWKDLVARLDGLILCGGADIEAARYGAAPDPSAQPPRPERDGSELSLVRAADAADMPVLGICRGMEVLAVAAGGTLEQHVPDRVGHHRHSPAPAAYGEMGVSTVPGTHLRAILGERVAVRCHHHQAIAAHPGYVASGSAPDGTLEAFEDPDRSFRIGVQWHPEVHDDNRLFTALVAAAR
ncbi:MAG: gamma-glutamyl-gamma-aminobutyrate hydrolase family protein [Streptosporangiales bacterium]